MPLVSVALEGWLPSASPLLLVRWRGEGADALLKDLDALSGIKPGAKA
jgi:hypothetical protein